MQSQPTTPSDSLSTADIDCRYLNLGNALNPAITFAQGATPVSTGGELSYAGILDLTLPSGFAPTIGEQFSVFSFRSETGSFSQINAPPLPAGESWNLSGIYTTGIVTVVPEPASSVLTLASGTLLLRRRQRRIRRTI